MNEVKKFPIVLTIANHKKIKRAAEELHLSMNRFFLEAVQEKLERENINY